MGEKMGLCLYIQFTGIFFLDRTPDRDRENGSVGKQSQKPERLEKGNNITLRLSAISLADFRRHLLSIHLEQERTHKQKQFDVKHTKNY